MIDEPGIFLRTIPSVPILRAERPAPERMRSPARRSVPRALFGDAAEAMAVPPRARPSDEIPPPEDEDGQGQDEDRVAEAVEERREVDPRRDGQAVNDLRFEVEVLEVGQDRIEDADEGPAQAGGHLLEDEVQAPGQVADE